MFDLDPLSCRVFLAAYRSVMPLSQAALETAVAIWSVVRAHNLFLYEGLYAEGNERRHRFIRPGGFVPFEERWSPVAAAL